MNFILNRKIGVYIIIFFLNLFNPLFNSFLRELGFFGFLSIFRDLAIFILFIDLFLLIKIKKDHFIVLILIFLFTIVYLMQAYVQGKLIIGFSYVRVYVIPILFLLISGRLLELDTLSKKHYKSIIKIIVISNLVSLLIVFLFYVKRSFVLELFTLKSITGAWLLQGDKIFRAGWPIGGANQLGIFTGSAFVFYFILIYEKKLIFQRNKKLILFLILNTLVLLLTFSRSSWIFVCLFLIGYLVFYRKKIKMKFFFGSLVLTFLGLTVVFFIYKDALLTWINGTINFTDLSSQGHLTSLINALKDIKEYFLFGYPKGTVGPRAQLYSGDMYHVENSLLMYLMDFGIFILLIYSLILLLALNYVLKNKVQLLYLIALIFPFLILPYGQDVETLINVTFFIYLLGSLDYINT